MVDTKEKRAERWRRWAEKNAPRVIRVCVNCSSSFSPHGPQKRCESCLTHACVVCGALFRAPGVKARKACSRSCAAKQPQVVARINAHRGVKPRTFYKRERTKHGSAEEREWRDAVFSRDKWTCQGCSAVGGRLNADHIKPWSTHPELRFDVSNGRTLCVACHRKTPTYGWRGYWLKVRSQRAALDSAEAPQ